MHAYFVARIFELFKERTGINNWEKGMHIVEVCPYDHLADRRRGKVEDALMAQIIDRFLVHVSLVDSWDEEVATLLPWLRFTDVDYQADASGVP
jgi:hypothetical protein